MLLRREIHSTCGAFAELQKHPEFVSELSKHLQLLYIASSRRVASHLYMYRITTLMKFIRHVLLLTVTLGIFYRVCLRA